MTRADDILYLKLLLTSFGAAYIVRWCPKSAKGTLSSALGVALVLSVCGWQILHSSILVAMNIVIVKTCGRNLHWTSMAASFVYLTVFRSLHVFTPLPRFYPHANAVQLFMTLRCVGLGFELRDDPTLPRDVQSLFEYLFNFIGIFSGPYFSYKVYLDWIRINTPRKLPTSVQKAALATPALIAVLYVVSLFFDVDDMRTAAFAGRNFLYRLMYMCPVFVTLRMRVYIAWTLGEAACILAGLGAYPAATEPRCGQGPKDRQTFEKLTQKELDDCSSWSFETVKNVDILGCEFAPTFRNAMKAWNCSVQYWLATYVYRRAPKAYRTGLTMLVSAYWHGIHPGYYMSFLTIPLCLAVEDFAVRTFGTDEQKLDILPPGASKFGVFWWFFRMRGFEYMAMGFMLLDFEATWNYWKSIYFALHSGLVIVGVLCLVWPRNESKRG